MEGAIELSFETQVNDPCIYAKIFEDPFIIRDRVDDMISVMLHNQITRLRRQDQGIVYTLQ